MSQFKAGEKAIVLPTCGYNTITPFSTIEILMVRDCGNYPIEIKGNLPLALDELQPLPIPHGDAYWNIDGE